MKKEFFEAFCKIVKCDGRVEFLREIISYLASEQKKGERWISFPECLISDNSNSIDRTIWAVLVIMYGDYGTSPRRGWICDCEKAINFLADVINHCSEQESTEDSNEFYEEFFDAFCTVVSYNLGVGVLAQLILHVNEQWSEHIIDTDLAHPEQLISGDYGGVCGIIWAALVIMYGDYGASPRRGWIYSHEETIAFLAELIKGTVE